MKHIFLILPTFLLVACGQFSQKQGSTAQTLRDLNDGNYISEPDRQILNEIPAEIIDEKDISVTMGDDNLVYIDIAGQKAVVEYLKDDPNIALLINDIAVNHKTAASLDEMKALIIGLIDNNFETTIDGLPMEAQDLIEIGLGVIKGDASIDDLGAMLGVMLRSLLNKFLEDSPLGDTIAPIAETIIDRIDNNGNNNSNNGNTIVGSLLDLITDLF